MSQLASANEEAKQAWDGPLFDRYVSFRELIVDGTLPHAREALRLEPPRPGDRILDLGCGFGNTTLMLAELAGAEGGAVGVDVSPRFVEAAAVEAAEVGVGNVEYMTGDVQVMDLPGPFDYAFSMIGIMFFASPVQAFRNIRESLAPGGRLCAVVWRRKLDNDWLHRAELVADGYLDKPEETDEPTCGPGPFSMANADTVTEQLQIAGFEEVALRRCDFPIKIGNDLDHAVSFNLAIGPAGELVRLAGDKADEVRPVIEERLREALADLEGPDGVMAPASTWVISARAPL
jgi:SAM-dependent methyltransferase